MIAASIYNDDGKIVRVVTASKKTIALQTMVGEHLYLGLVDGNTQYMVDDEPTTRPAMPCVQDKSTIVANGTDVSTISGLPQDCHVGISGPVMSSIDVADGSFELTADVSGVYCITITCWPYLKKEFEIVAH